jgi:hypothetical protein
MKRLILLVLISLFYSDSASAGPCEGDIPSKSSGGTWCSNGDTGTIASDVTLTRDKQFSLVPSDNTTITNYGNILNDTNKTINTEAQYGGDNFTFNNKSTGVVRSTKSRAIWLRDNEDGVVINNEGEIYALMDCAICSSNALGSITITNSGTIHTGTTDLTDSDYYLWEVYNTAIGITSPNTGASYTINNSGTIKSVDDNLAGIYVEDVANATIINSGTIQGHGTRRAINIQDHGTETGTTIKLSGEPTFTNGIDLAKTITNIVLQNDITSDLTVEIYNYDGDLTITNELSGNDTYTLTEEDLDSDGTADDGTLTILGEDLEIDDENAKYRSENVLTKLRGLFDAVNYINWRAPEGKFFKIFHSTQKRAGTYKGEMSGVVGQLSPMFLGSLRSNVFIGYTKQHGDFDNGEFLGGDNFALGLKSVYENNGFKASFTPMVGLNDLTITDFDTDTKTKISTNLLSEFAGFNTKFGKEIKTSEDGSLNLSVQSTLGLQRFPQYLAKFSEGDLSVDEAIEQVLGAGFEVRYIEELGKGFIIQPYIGANVNNNLNNSIKITADGENKNKSPAYETTTGYFAGVSFTKEAKDMNFDLNLMYGNEDGLVNQIAAVSLTKSFGQTETKTPTTKSDKDIRDIRIASTISDKNLLEFGELKKLNKFLKSENERLKTENEKLKMLSAKVTEENKASKQLIVELLKENEKIKLEKEIFKNKILENENKELLEKIEKGVSKNEVNRFALLLFITVLILIAYGIISFIMSILQASFNTKKF